MGQHNDTSKWGTMLKQQKKRKSQLNISLFLHDTYPMAFLNTSDDGMYGMIIWQESLCCNLSCEKNYNFWQSCMPK